MPSVAYASKPRTSPTRLQTVAMRRSHTGTTVQLSLASPPTSPPLRPIDTTRCYDSAPTTPAHRCPPTHNRYYSSSTTPPLSPRRKASNAAKTAAQLSVAHVLWQAADDVTAVTPTVPCPASPQPSSATTGAQFTVTGMIKSLAARWTGTVERTVARAQRDSNPAFALAAGWHALAARLLLLRPVSSGQDSGTQALLRVLGVSHAAFSAMSGQACWQSKRSQHSQLAILGLSNLAQVWALFSALSLRGHNQLLRLLAGGNVVVALVTFVYWLRRVLLLRQRQAVQQQKRKQFLAAANPVASTSTTTTSY